MSSVPDNVQQVLLQLVPAFVIRDITCYVFYDNHPRDQKNIDVILCTKMGDVREYFQRDLLASFNVDSKWPLTDIRILRNSHGDLFYLVFGGDEITILSRRDKLEGHHKLVNVSRYELTDSSCMGHPTLKVFYKDSDIPVVPDDNFENFKYLDFSTTMAAPQKAQETEMLLTNLNVKLTEARYCLKSNEKSYQDFLKMRHSVAFSIYKKIHPNLDDSQFRDGFENLARKLKIHTQTPWIKACNKKVVIVYFVCNRNEEALEDVVLLLHVTGKYCIEYTTKIFEKTTTPPFWDEKSSQTLRSKIESAIVVVIDVEELKDNIISKVEFNGVISYMKSGNECILPIDDVMLSPLDTMEEQFDVLSTNPMDSNIMLAVLASTVKTDLILRHMKTEAIDQHYLSFSLFSQYLDMDNVLDNNNIVIYRKSPYHVLNGLMIMSQTERRGRSDHLPVTVYSRTSSQVLALIHHIHNCVPYPIVTTTPNYRITAKSERISITNEDTQCEAEPTYNYMNYAPSMLIRTGLVIEYLDKSMIKMSETKDAEILSKLGKEIDLFAQGEADYREFKEKMRAEAAKGVKMLSTGLESVPMVE